MKRKKLVIVLAVALVGALGSYKFVFAKDAEPKPSRQQ